MFAFGNDERDNHIYVMRFLLRLLLLGLVVVGGFWMVYRHNLKPVSGVDSSESVIIPKGASAVKTAEILKDHDLIRSVWAFKFFLRLNRRDNQLHAGKFSLSKSWSTPEIIDFLSKGGFEGVWVTTLEGWRREQVAIAFDQALGENFSTSDFLNLTADREGQLFPDTYLVPVDADATMVLKMLDSTFESKVGKLLNDSVVPPDPLSANQVLVLASLLEREAADKDEYPIVAGILINRLRQGWPLQVDATLQYVKANLICDLDTPACDDWWPIALSADKDIDSPFNTYAYPGLPPAPIASPGVETVSAVLNPKFTSYMFYITDQKGSMHYSKTLDEHNRNVEKYLR